MVVLFINIYERTEKLAPSPPPSKLLLTTIEQALSMEH